LIGRINAAALLAALNGEVAAQVGRWTLWTPVAFGVGAAVYFGLKSEPPLWIALTAAALSLALAAAAGRFARRRSAAIACGLLAFAACGYATANVKAALVAAPRIPTGYGVGRIEGWVVDVSSPSTERGRLLIAPSFISHLPKDALPARVRVVVAPDAVFGPGEAVRLTALLDPPPAPAAPGAFDFARDAWFERVGGVGLALKQPELIDLPRPSMGLRLQMRLNRVRWRLARRLVDDIQREAPGAGEGAAGLAAAVTTSHQGWLPQSAADDLRGSGLAHMLAIAGLHTAAVSGFVFAALRLSVAATPWLALRISGKKAAAIGGLAAVAAYLLLSGGHPPAKRAAITAAVAFIAMIFDRRAISLRSLAAAALIVLMLQPEAVVQPGFQMSFSATAALVALAEIWPQGAGPKGAPWLLAAAHRGRDWVIGLLAVSTVAGAATAPFAIQHFNRIANYGTLANLSADFLASAVMMPALAIATAGEALGANGALLKPVLFVAAWAARGVLAIGHLCARAPGAGVAASSAPPIAMLIAFLGILFACLWKGRLRWIGAPLAAAVLIWPRPPAPVAWIANDGDDAAVAIKGQIIALKPDARAYATELWAARRGLTAPKDPTAARDALFDCDRRGCTPKSGTSPAIGAWWSKLSPPEARFADLCERAQIIVIRYAHAPPRACEHKLVLYGQDFEARGAAEIYPARSGWRVIWAQPIRGDRPWTRPSDNGE